MTEGEFKAATDYADLLERAEDMRRAGVDVRVWATPDGFCIDSGLFERHMFVSADAVRGFLYGVSALSRLLPSPTPEHDDPAIHVDAFAFEVGHPASEAVHALLKAVVDPSATKLDRLLAASNVVKAVAEL